MIHDDDDVACLLRSTFEEHGFEVEDATTMASAERRLDAGGVGAILIGWESKLGRAVHRWVFDHHRELLHRCILVVDAVPADAAALMCRTCRLDDLDGLLDATTSTMGEDRPRMLLVDDDPALLGEMAVLLESLDFDVITASGGKAALDYLQHAVFDVVLCDWQMPGISGVQVHRWVAEHRPELLRKMVFITGGDLDAVRDGDARPLVVAKGTDSPTLLGYLHQAVGPSSCFAHGTPPLSSRSVAVREVAVHAPALRRPRPPRPAPRAAPEDDGIPIDIVLG